MRGLIRTRRGTSASPVTIFSGSVAVPSTFVGMHFHRWPVAREGAASISSAPTYRYGVARSHDSSFDYDGTMFWRGLNRSQGQYTWGASDIWVNAHAGKALNYCIYGTPQWAAANTSAQDAYGYTGGASPPTNLQHITDFVTALLTRYNSGPTKPIKFIEVWNEPKFDGLTTGFYWGTATQMAQFARAVYQAAKAVDPSITVMSPGFTGIGSIEQFLNASDAAGGFGRDWMDVFAHHPYGSHYSPGPRARATNIDVMTADVRAKMALGGLAADYPLYCTEMGWTWDRNDADLPSITDEAMAKWAKCVVVRAASLGWKSWTFYSHDDVLTGNPSINPAIARAIDWIQQTLAGRTLLQIRKMYTTLEVTTDAGVFLID